MKLKKWICIICAAACAAGFLGCSVWLLKYWKDVRSAEEKMEEVMSSYVQEPGGVVAPAPAAPTAAPKPQPAAAVPSQTPAPGGTAETEPLQTPEPTVAPKVYPGVENYSVPDTKIDFAGLTSTQNADIYAWIKIPGTKVDYPIVQHPEDPNYYLNHNLNGSKGYPGCIYTELANSKDWDDPITVIYGHNMKNGSMFANLHYYEDEDFFEKHPYVYIYSPDMTRVYQVFAAYETSNVHMLLRCNMNDPDSYQEYLDGIREEEGIRNNYNDDIELTWQDRIITLSTCIGSKPDERYVVQAVLVAEGAAD